MSFLLMIGISILVLFAAAQSVAEGVNCTDRTCSNEYPYNIDTFQILLNKECGFFNSVGGAVCKANSAFDLSNPSGIWGITVIANEAGNHLQVIMLKDDIEYVLFDKPDYGNDGADDDECNEFGVWKEVNFGAGESLIFKNLTNARKSTIPLASTPHSSCETGDFETPCELKQKSNALSYLGVPQKLDEGYVVIGWEDLTDCDHADIIFAMRRVSSPGAVVPLSTACVEYGKIGAGNLYIKIPRVDGGCDVDIASLEYYLNDKACVSTAICGDSGVDLAAGCQYDASKLPTCYEQDSAWPDDLTTPPDGYDWCIDETELANVLSTSPGSPCNESFSYKVGSPTCTDYRTHSGVRIKACVLDNGKTCPWKKCCKKKKKVSACGF